MMKSCISCESPIVGRPDKKFCSDVCRYEYHNNNRMVRQSYTSMVIKSMRKNRLLLRNLFERGIIEVNRKDLEFIGFNFHAITGVECDVQLQKITRYCFEYKLEEIGEQIKVSIFEPKIW